MELSKSEKYVLKYKKEEKRLKDLGRKEGRKAGEKAGPRKLKAVEMAKVMKKDGKTSEEIMRFTKLSKSKLKNCESRQRKISTL